MSLKDVHYKAAYVSGMDNLVKDFYIPTLKESVMYQRRTGYFNSRALAMAARGLSGLLKNNGKMQLLCSVHLDKSEEEVLKDPILYLEKRSLDVSNMLEQPYDELEKKRLGLLAQLLASGQLEIKIGLRRGGIYHEKAGIFKDNEGSIVAFNGSGNETPGGWVNNTESFHAFTSWDDDRHIRPEIETFERLWNGRDPKTQVIPLPFAVVKGILEFQDYFKEGVDDPIDPLDVDTKPQNDFTWTPQLAYILEAPRLWNHRDFAYAETAVRPFEHQDFIASTVLENWPPRFLFADEVGLGKTIEAGLVIKGFLAAGRIERLLILAPANVTRQWQEELFTKFGIEAWRLRGEYVIGPQIDPNEEPKKEPVDAANPFRSKPIMIVSSQLIRIEERLEQLLGLEYDMVILDEAHHARSGGPPNKREPNKLLQAMEELRYHIQGLILMTATPIQLSRMDLWDLLGILELPGKWQDAGLFDRFFLVINSEEIDWGFLIDMVNSSLDLTGIDESALKLLREDYPNVDEYRLLHIMKEKQPSAINELTSEEKQALKVLLYRHTPVRLMVFRHTRELLKRYKAEGKFSGKIAERNPNKVTVELVGSNDDLISERGLYNRIEKYVKEYYAKYSDIQKGMGFVMEVYRKRLTSSTYAIKKSLERRYERLGVALETGNYGLLIPELDEDEDEIPDEMLDEIANELSSKKEMRISDLDSLRKIIEAEYNFIGNFLGDLRALNYDSKANELDSLVSEIFGRGKRRIILFSQYGDTVEFLLDYFLQKYGNRLGSYTGAGGTYRSDNRWVLCSKQDIQNKFSDPYDPLSFLICTDAASEGLNLQTCDTLINYDIPWNPMRIEQRIGRIDRIGQESPFVDIYTIFYKDSVEEKAYNRCLERIDFFKSALGHLQPILQATEKAIRNAALARTVEDENKVFEDFQMEMHESVAQVDENLRIERLLNHYEPRLPMMTNKAPITQDELEEVLKPYLSEKGWNYKNGIWTRDEKRITFDMKIIDRKGEKAELITPLSNIVKLIGNLPDLPDEFEFDGRKVHRLGLEGFTGFALESEGQYRIAKNIKDFEGSDDIVYYSLDEAREGLKYLISEQRRKYLESELKAWNNRRYNWEIRARMYLDYVAKWRWHSTKKVKGLFEYSRESLIKEWKEYVESPERETTKELADLINYKPDFDPEERMKGKPSKKSPRDYRKEKLFRDDYYRINNKIILLKNQIL